MIFIGTEQSLKIYSAINFIKRTIKLRNTHTVFPLINAGPKISAAPLGIHIEINASL